jgi:hypothetical protein
MPYGYAQQKFFEALYALVSENKPLRIRLTLAAEYPYGDGRLASHREV